MGCTELPPVPGVHWGRMGPCMGLAGVMETANGGGVGVALGWFLGVS